MNKLFCGMTLIMLLSCCTSKNNLQNSILKKGVTVVEIGAEWCPACIESKPFIEKLQKEFGFKLIYIDADQSTKLRKDYLSTFNIMFIPTISIFKDGKIYYHGPFPSKEKFRQLLIDAGN